MFIFVIITVIVIWHTWICRKGVVLSTMSSSLSKALSLLGNVFSELSEVFLVIGAGSMLCLLTKWNCIYFFFSNFFFFESFYGEVLKVWVRALIFNGDNHYLVMITILWIVRYQLRDLVTFRINEYWFRKSLTSIYARLL